jgi:hypothetical protein
MRHIAKTGCASVEHRGGKGRGAGVVMQLFHCVLAMPPCLVSGLFSHVLQFARQ